MGEWAIPVIITAVAVALAIAAARGKWVVYRIVMGLVSFCFALVAGCLWVAMIGLAQTGPETEGGSLYIGWNPRQMLGSLSLSIGLVIVLFLSLIVWAGHRRKQARGSGKA